MKKNYERPFVEKVEFDYSEQVVATSNTPQSVNIGVTDCTSWHNTNDDSCPTYPTSA